MFRCVFTSAVLLLLVVMMCCGSGAATAEQGNVKAVDALLGIKWDRHDNWEDFSNAGVKYGLLRDPSLVEVQGLVFAIAEVHCKDWSYCSDASFTGIASWYLGLNGDSDPTEMSTVDASILGTYLLKEGSEGVSTTNSITRPTTLVIGNGV
ncbi:trans-sialidase [Trypanosoma cruzi]|nr:trans-sialidase [Trypanosoma cruzi]